MNEGITGLPEETFEPLRAHNFMCLVGNRLKTEAEDIPEFSDIDHVVDMIFALTIQKVNIGDGVLEIENFVTKDYTKQYPLLNIVPDVTKQYFIYLVWHTSEGETVLMNKLLCSYSGYTTALDLASDDMWIIKHKFTILTQEAISNLEEERKKFSNLFGASVFNTKREEKIMAIITCVCGYDYSGNYCPKCGKPHDEKVEEKKQLSKQCSACKTLNEYGSSYCVECGESFTQLLMEDKKD